MTRHLALWLVSLACAAPGQEPPAREPPAASPPSPRAQLREKQRALAADDHVGRLALARWAVEQTLRPEATQLLLLVAEAGAGTTSAEAAELLRREPIPELRRAFAARVLELVNVERAREKLKPLKRDERAEKAAEGHAEDMARRQFFAHDTPEGTGPGPRIEKAGCKQYGWAENIAVAQDTPAEVVDSWMKSPPHRANILNPALTHLGVGMARGAFRAQQDELYWVQVFLDKTKPKPGK